MKIKFWGVRGSMPTPLKPREVKEKLVQAILELPANIDVHDERVVRSYVESLPALKGSTAGGNTPCVEIRSGQDIIVVDAGSGLRELGLELMRGPLGLGRGTLHLFISHTHWDHLHGFTMFPPALIPGNHIYIYGGHDLKAAFRTQHTFNFWPVTLEKMLADVQFIRLKPGATINIGQMQVTTHKAHHPGSSYCYRFTDQLSTLVYASDVEYKDLEDAYVAFYRDADALIFDAQYTLRDAWTREDWGHSSALIGVDLAEKAGVKQLFLFHHDPTHSDAELEEIRTKAQTFLTNNYSDYACDIVIAVEGMTVDLTPETAVAVQRSPDSETAILTPARTFDEVNVKQLAQQLAHINDSVQSIVDLSQVETLTTDGLKALVKLQREKGVPLVLVIPAENVRQIISLTGYQDCFAVYPSIEAATAAVQARESAYLPGQIINRRYQIERRLGESSLGAVVQAIDTQQKCTVALKILSPVFSPQTVEHLLRRSRQITTLIHPNIVRVYAWEQTAETTYAAEEFVNGSTLEERLTSDEAITTKEALEIADSISEALEYAHSRGVIHGDLKPSNIFLTPEGVKIGGFGLGGLTEGRDLRKAILLFLDAAYLAPEQVAGQLLDARTDLYALGVILYRLFTHRLPFTGETQAVLQAHVQEEPRRPSTYTPAISPALEHLILKLLRKNPNERYSSSLEARRISSSLLLPSAEASINLTDSHILGRDQQKRVLQQAWQKACDEHGQIVFITGEPGIGKTALAQQVAAESGASIVLIAQAEERSEMPAYHLFAQLLRAYFATVPPEFNDIEARQMLADFSRLVPEIRQMLADLPLSPGLEPAQERLRLMGSLTRFIQQATQQRPWFIILDNLQWADVNSLELLHYLARHLATMRVLIVGAYRDTDLSAAHPLLRTLHILNRNVGYRSLQLERLDRKDTSELLRHIWQNPVPAALCDKIYERTNGNPFYIEEVAKEFKDEGIISVTATGEWTFPELETLALPNSIRETVMHRIQLLSPSAQALLQQAAVLGQTFHFKDLQAMSGLSEWDALEYLELALERRLIQEMSSDGQFRFRHTEIYQVLYETLGTLRRRLLHRQAGEAIERRAGAEAQHRVEELAYHFSQAGEPERFIAYSLPAARQAQTNYANETAISWYTRTLDMLRLMGPSKDMAFQSLEMSIHKALGELLSYVGRYGAALEHSMAALALLDKVPASDKLNRQRAELCYHMAAAYEGRSDYHRAMEWLEHGMQEINTQQPSPELARLHYLSGWIDMRQGRYNNAKAQFERALILARALKLHQVEANTIRALGMIAWYHNAQENAQTCFEEALRLYHELGERQGESHTLNNLGMIAADNRQFAEAYFYYQQALEIYEEIGDRPGIAKTWYNLSDIFRRQGNLGRAHELGLRALELQKETDDRRGIGRCLAALGATLSLCGAYPHAQAYLEQALEIQRDINDQQGLNETLNTLGWMRYDQHNYGQALAHAQESLASEQSIESRNAQINAWLIVGYAHAAQNEVAAAAAAFAQARAYQSVCRTPHFSPLVEAGLAQLELAAARLDAALQHIHEVLHYLEENSPLSNERPFQLYRLCWQVLDAIGDPRATATLAAAQALRQAWADQIADAELHQTFLAYTDFLERPRHANAALAQDI